MDSNEQSLTRHPIVIGIGFLLIAAIWVYKDIYFYGESTSSFAFLSGVLSIIFLSLGIYTIIANASSTFIENFNNSLLFNIILGIILILFDNYMIVPLINGWNSMLYLPVLVSIFTLLLTGLLCIFHSIYRFFKG
jgi:hypothetical protein